MSVEEIEDMAQKEIIEIGSRVRLAAGKIAVTMAPHVVTELPDEETLKHMKGGG